MRVQAVLLVVLLALQLVQLAAMLVAMRLAGRVPDPARVALVLELVASR